jgi:hypothetical protein
MVNGVLVISKPEFKCWCKLLNYIFYTLSLVIHNDIIFSLFNRNLISYYVYRSFKKKNPKFANIFQLETYLVFFLILKKFHISQVRIHVPRSVNNLNCVYFFQRKAFQRHAVRLLKPVKFTILDIYLKKSFLTSKNPISVLISPPL